MEELKKMKMFESFQISKLSMDKLQGSRSVAYGRHNVSGDCLKIVDRNDGRVVKIKNKDRYDDKC